MVQPGSDMDTLCIAPPHITREAFFDSFLQKLEQHPQVSDCVPIPGAPGPRAICLDSSYTEVHAHHQAEVEGSS